MTSPRSVTVRLGMDPSSYIAGAARAESSTLSLDRAVSRVGPSTTTSMEQAARGAGTAEGALGKANKSAGALGLTLGGLAGVGGAVAVALSVKWAGDYQSSLTKLSTTAGESQANLKMVGQGMLDMAGQVGIGADELAKGMYTVESSGIHGADALTVLKASAQGARQENADLAKVTDAVTTALHDYSLPATDAAKVTSQLITAVSHGKTTFDELTGAMHSVTPLAAALHVPLADIAGTLSAMTASGESADQAAQNMADALRHMQNPTSTMTAELAQLGINSADLGTQLGTRGLSGTIQGISEAILTKMGPSGKVLLGAFNESKVASQDLQTMIANMPPSLAKTSKAFLDGSVSIGDYRKGAKELGGTNGAMALQFLSLVDSSQGFNNMLKSGAPDAQTYTAALQKAMGTSAGLTVALQVTGEHAAATNDAIKDIAGSAGDAQGNIKGWDEVQGNFNQQLAQSEAHAKSLAIEAGQHLLPILTAGLGWLNSTGVPALEHLGSAVGDAAHWFSQLPGPVKETAGALAGLVIADKVGVFTALASGVERLGAGVAAVPQKLRSFAGGWGPAAIGIAGITAAVMASNDEIDSWAKGLEQGGEMARTATAEMTRAHDSSILDAHSVSDAWTLVKGMFADGLAEIEGYSSALDKATQEAQDWYNALPLMQRNQQDVTVAQNDLNQAIDDYGQNSSAAKYQAWLLGLANDSLRINQQELKVATDGVNGSLAGQLSLQQQLAQSGQNYDEAIYNTGKAIDSYTASMKLGKKHTDEQHQALDNVTQSFFGVLDAAKRKADAETQGLPQAQIVNQEIVRQRDALDDVVKKLGFVPPALQGMYDSLNGPTAQALEAAKTNVNNMGTAMTTVSNTDIDGTFLPALDKLAHAAGTTFPQAVTGGFLPSTDQMVGKLNGPTVTALQGATSWMDYWTAQMSTGVPGAIQGPFAGALQQANGYMANTGGQAQITGGQVAGLGQDIIGLPGAHNTVITADAMQANNTINDFLTRMNRDGFVGAQFNLTPLGAPAPSSGPIGLPPVPHKAAGGAIVGPGTGTSDSVLIAASNGEHMWTTAETSAAGGHAGVEQLRRAVLAGGGGLAAGGPVPTSVSYPFDLNGAAKGNLASQLVAAAAAAAARAAAAMFGGVPASRAANEAAVNHAASYYGWSSGPEWEALVKVIMRESGFNNTAQNPSSTSSAYGMFQFLDSTWRNYGGTKTSDSADQSRMGMTYIFDRYNDPLGAYAHEQQFGWYHDGGPVTGPAGATVPAFLKVGEVVRTADQEASVQSRLQSQEMAGGAGGGPQAINVAITGARISGRLELGADGFITLVDGRIDQVIGQVADRIHYAGGN